jgi:hypothetical protein
LGGSATWSASWPPPGNGSWRRRRPGSDEQPDPSPRHAGRA